MKQTDQQTKNQRVVSIVQRLLHYMCGNISDRPAFVRLTARNAHMTRDGRAINVPVNDEIVPLWFATDSFQNGLF